MIIGLVGKPNVGKSTFFKAATLANVEIAPYPFTTIDANEGVAYVKVECPEKLIGKKCSPNHGFCIDGNRFVPIKLVDVAGLVPEAHKGKGRGNEFLSDLSEADCLIHVVDVSGRTNENGEPTENYNVIKDIDFINKEIEMWIKGILTRNWQTLERKAKQTSLVKEISEQLSGLKVKEETVKEIISKLNLDEKGNWTDTDLLDFSIQIRKKSKPMIIAANKADLPESKENIKLLKERFPDTLIIPCSADYEIALKEASKLGLINYIPGDDSFSITNPEKLTESQKKALEKIEDYLKKWKSTGVQECLNKAVFEFLNYIVVYPVENENKWTDSKNKLLPDALLLPQGSTALDLAFSIHTDIGKNFMSAIDAKTKKRLGKDSKLNNHDIIKILTK